MTINLNLTERELTVIIMALETAKREEARDGDETKELNIAEIVALRNKLRDA